MISSEKNCPVCLSEESISFGTKNNLSLKRCKSCQTVFADVNFENSEVTDKTTEIYNHYYDNAKFKLSDTVEKSLQKIVKTFETSRKTNNLIDIGFGEGGLLSVAEKNNWKCFGTELSPQSLKHGNERGWTVSQDALSDERFPKEGFDVVTMIELIEHIPNPDFFLKTAFSLLRPGGILFMTTPNIKSINGRWLETDWSVVAPPEHITIWSPKGMKESLKRNGFLLSLIKTEGFNPIEIVERFKTKDNQKVVAANRNETAFALNETFSKSNWRMAVKSIINNGLSVLKLGDGIKVWATKHSKN